MAYSEREARELLVKAGHVLTEKKLIARTWGNISARISDEEFIITPSGRAYDTLTANDMVKVKIADLSYEGEIKPSGEKGIHAAVYGIHRDVNFVVHTHQDYATAVSLSGESFPFVPLVEYGLSGTKKLIENVKKAVFIYIDSHSFLLSRHGTLCFGKDDSEAFANCLELEELCKLEYKKRVKADPAPFSRRAYVDDFAQMAGPFVTSLSRVKTDDPEALKMVSAKNDMACAYAALPPLSWADCMLQHTVYKLKYSRQIGNGKNGRDIQE